MVWSNECYFYDFVNSQCLKLTLNPSLFFHYLFGWFGDFLGQCLPSNMTLLTSVMGMSYSGGMEV